MRMREDNEFMKTKALIFATFLPLLLASCGPHNVVYIGPGVYRLSGDATGEVFNITKDTYFTAKSTGYSFSTGEAGSFQDENQFKTKEEGHWYISGQDHLLDLEWRNCDLATKQSAFRIGFNGDYQYIEEEYASFELLGMKKGGSNYELKIICRPKGAKKDVTFVFSQVVE